MPYPAGGFKGTTTANTPVNNNGVDATLISQQRELTGKNNHAKVFETAALMAFKAAMGRLKASQITSLKCSGGIVTYYVVEPGSGKNAPIPGGPKNPPVVKFSSFANANLTAWHWVQGVSNLNTATKFNGLYDGDITYGSLASGVRAISLRQIRPDLRNSSGVVGGVQALGGNGAVIWSIDNTKTTPRADINPASWNKYLTAAAGKGTKKELTYSYMPTIVGDPLDVSQTGSSTIVANGSTAPLSETGGNNSGNSFNNYDDVQWAHVLYTYWQHCMDYRKTISTALNEVNQKIKGQRAAWGKLHPTVQDNTKTDGAKHGSTTTDKGKKTKTTGVDPLGSHGPTTVGNDTKPVIYNLPVPKNMYFKQGEFGNEFVPTGNAPGRVNEGSNLWSGTQHVVNKKKHINKYVTLWQGAHKGMIQSYVVPGNVKGNSKFWDPNSGLNKGLKSVNKRRYAFQFMYNPSTVSMHYAGAPQVDIGLETSGADKVALIGSGVSSSTVTFQLLLNRMQDMKYIQALIQKDIDWKEVYPNNANHPDTSTDPDVTSISEEFKEIRDKGTMYDVEYLLRTLIGYQLPSQLRGGALTADIGYLGAYPVELHLGKNMRYLVTIDSFDITHTIFTKDMVPIFTNLAITCNRLPEFNKNLSQIELKTTPAASDTTTSGN